MHTEFEATFVDIDVDEIRERLRSVGATLERPEYLQKRTVFHLPDSVNFQGGWGRVRDEGDKVTLSIKAVVGDAIGDQKEVSVVVDDYESGEEILQTLGCVKKAYQESKRELWMLENVEITIDTWPFLEPFVEVEGASEEAVRSVSEKIGFQWSSALFCSVDTQYTEKYGVSEEVINNKTPLLVFDMDNPFQ